MDERQRASAGEREAVRQAARALAFDWYLAALLAPSHARDDLVTLAAYLGETARIPATVTEPGLGAIRLQWWRDAIANGADGARTGNPVADALTELARRRALPDDMLELPLAGREHELDADGLTDEADFQAYLDETWGTAFRLAARALGVEETDPIRSLCNLAADAYGRMRLALDLPRHLEHGRLPLPASRLADRDPRNLPESEARSAANALVATLAKEAREVFAEARTALRAAPAAVRPAFLPLALVEPYLRALENPGHDPLRDIADISPLVRVRRLWLAKLRARV
jgi:phytoene synthase